MKTLFASALIATAALTGAASAQVAPGVAGAIAHFNQDYDTQDQRIIFRGGSDSVVVSTRNGGSIQTAFDQFNATVDSPSDRVGKFGATVVSGTPAFAADIHARIRAEGLEDE